MITLQQLQERPLSYSSLKEFAKSPRHYLDYLNRKKETTPAMQFGSMVHCLLLQPDKFDSQFAIMPTIDKRTKEGKEAYNKFLEGAVGLDVVMENDYNDAKAITDNVLSNPELAKYIINCHQFEYEFRAEMWGLPIRGFFDGVSKDYILEVKTTMDASPDNLMRDFYNRQYHMQAGLYNMISGWRLYATQSAVLAALSLALLYLTVMSFGTLMTAFLKWNGMKIKILL